MQEIDFYTKTEIDGKFSPSWVGSYDDYIAMPSHNPTTLYTTVDDNGNVRQFLGDTELKSGTQTAGTTIRLSIGKSNGTMQGTSEVVNDD